MNKINSTIIIVLLLLVSCEKITPEYPDEPFIDYQAFSLFITVDELNNKTLVGRLSFEFTDGDGNVGLPPLADSLAIVLPDTMKYNFFLQLYDLKGYEYEKVPEEDGGLLKYRIPFLDNQPLRGTIDLDIYYKDKSNEQKCRRLSFHILTVEYFKQIRLQFKKLNIN